MERRRVGFQVDVYKRQIDDLHKRVRRLADRVHELETRESVNSLVQSPTAVSYTHLDVYKRQAERRCESVVITAPRVFS